MKGIILAGGKGTRLMPTTLATCKQLLPIYDKPLIYYPLSVLMMAKIRDILIISTPEDQERFQHLLGDGSQLGIRFHYAVQEEPKGIADAFLIGERFIGEENVALVLGDNIFYGHDMPKLLQDAKRMEEGALVFGYEVHDPERYGVLSFGPDQKIDKIIEKPAIPPSRYAVTGLYFYDNDVVDIARRLKPSLRGELEITDVNNVYLKQGKLRCHLFDRGFAWLDTGTAEAMHDASNYVATLQRRQGIQIGCVEEVAYKMGFIDEEQLIKLAHQLSPSAYGEYILTQLTPSLSSKIS